MHPDIIVSSPSCTARSVIVPILSSALFESTTIRTMSDARKAKSEEEWRAILTPEQVRPSLACSHGLSHSPSPYANAQFKVLRLKGTERAGTGQYVHSKEAGVYSCTACKTPLYKSGTKFDSGSGWPAFFDGNALSLLDLSRRGKLSFVLAIPGAVSRHVDFSSGMARTEIVCTACGGHLGHVFKGEGYRTPSRVSSPLERYLGEPFL